VALSQVRRTDGGRRTIHSGTTPTPFSTAPGHGCMKSLAHRPHSLRFRVSRRSVSPFHPGIFFLSLPRSTSAIDSSLHGRAGCYSSGLADSYELLHPPSLHSICIRPASAAPAASF
jgi:hypothetical protein